MVPSSPEVVVPLILSVAIVSKRLLSLSAASCSTSRPRFGFLRRRLMGLLLGRTDAIERCEGPVCKDDDIEDVIDCTDSIAEWAMRDPELFGADSVAANLDLNGKGVRTRLHRETVEYHD